MLHYFPFAELSLLQDYNFKISANATVLFTKQKTFKHQNFHPCCAKGLLNFLPDVYRSTDMYTDTRKYCGLESLLVAV